MTDFLRKVSRPDTFWLKKDEYAVVGEICSLEELLSALKKTDSVSHHIRDDRNDFAVWIEKVIRDRKLAERIAKIKPDGSAVEKLVSELETRINILKKYSSTPDFQ